MLKKIFECFSFLPHFRLRFGAIVNSRLEFAWLLLLLQFDPKHSLFSGMIKSIRGIRSRIFGFGVSLAEFLGFFPCVASTTIIAPPKFEVEERKMKAIDH